MAPSFAAWAFLMWVFFFGSTHGQPAVLVEAPLISDTNPVLGFGIGSSQADFVCGAAMLQGWRPYQEDRLLCMPNVDASLSIENGKSFPSIPGLGLFGVFDGHNGDEASDFAVKSFYNRFLQKLNCWSLQGLPISEALGDAYLMASSESEAIPALPQLSDTDAFCGSKENGSQVTDVLLEAIRSAVVDIDALFLRWAKEKKLQAGSTACIAALTTERVLIANVGDSKALVCSKCKDSFGIGKGYALSQSFNAGARLRNRRKQNNVVSMGIEEEFCSMMLTSDHHPNKPEEKQRIEAYGGVVINNRVNGLLAVSRSIGDAEFKKYGVISEPEFFDLPRGLKMKSYLVLASDGLFESLAPQDICELLGIVEHYAKNSWSLGELETSFLLAQAMAKALVIKALELGSRDNISALVIPLYV